MTDDDPLSVDATEEVTERDGLLSSYPEWHAFVLGMYAHIGHPRRWPDIEEWRERNEDVDKEPHYFVGGGLATVVIQLAILWLLILAAF